MLRLQCPQLLNLEETAQDYSTAACNCGGLKPAPVKILLKWLLFPVRTNSPVWAVEMEMEMDPTLIIAVWNG